MNGLELFQGSGDFTILAKEMGHTMFGIDWEDFGVTDKCMDIGELIVSDVPYIPEFVWISFDCTTYSIAACSTHRMNSIIPKSEYAKKCDDVNIHTIGVLKEWISMNPNLVFFIENPRGMLRKMPFMQEFKRHTVWYCQYGDTRAKPTDIWTNSKTWIPRQQCKNGNINCHHEKAPRGSRTGTQGKKGVFERSRVPKELHREILMSLN